MRVELYRLPVASPDDVSPLADLIHKGAIQASEVAAVIAQNEGDYYARGFTLHMLEELLSGTTGQSRESIRRRVPLLMIGLAHVAPLSPHLNVVVVKPGQSRPGPEKRLVAGTGVTRDLLPEEYGTMAQVEEVAPTVRRLVKDAGITAMADVHCVYVKVPELTDDRVKDAASRGRAPRAADYRTVGNYTRGAAALGVALALGEIDARRLSDDAICRDWDLYSRVAHVSSGIEQTSCRVVVLGNAGGSASDLVAGHCLMNDPLDVDGFKNGLRSVGLKFDCCPDAQQRARVENIFIGTSANFLPTIRGRRHTMHTDFLWGFAGAQAKAMANAVIAGIMGDTMFLAKSGSEHQGPRGSNVVALFARA
ncbi:MAG: ring-opening amidohydrolase [Candidatus Rokubacteria bacterium]|nr:ring-opening amidohydrolase [Candidatus Rokubacteria bacterium]